MFNNKKRIEALEKEIERLETLRVKDNRWYEVFLGNLGVDNSWDDARQVCMSSAIVPNIVHLQSTVGGIANKLGMMNDTLNGKHGEAISKINELGRRFDALEQYLGIEYKTLISKQTVEELKGYDKVKKISKKK